MSAELLKLKIVSVESNSNKHNAIVKKNKIYVLTVCLSSDRVKSMCCSKTRRAVLCKVLKSSLKSFPFFYCWYLVLWRCSYFGGVCWWLQI